MNSYKYIIIIILFFTNLLCGYGQTVGLFTNHNSSFNGYTLFSPGRSTSTYLIDNCGYTVNVWYSDYKSNNSVYFLESGHLLKTCKIDASSGYGGRIEKYNWDGDLVWSYNFDDEDFSLHHDIEPMPNGNILVISYDIYTPSEAISEGRNPSTLESVFKSEKIIEIEPVDSTEANIVWEWYVWDHLIQDYDDSKSNFGTVEEHPELININYYASTGPNAKTDWVHFNSIDYNSELDQIILSSRNISEIYIIDHSTTFTESSGHDGGIYGKGGDLLYRYGNPAAYNRGLPEDRLTYYQHDANWIKPGFPDEDKIVLFNNQAGPDSSTICMFKPPEDSSGFYSDPGMNAFGPDTFEWVYGSPEIYSSKISGAQQLPNGNALICSGVTGKFVEIDIDGNIVWEYINPDGSNGPVNQGTPPSLNAVFKIERYAPDYPGFDGLTLVPGDPVELNPWPSDCEILEDTLANIDLKVFLEGSFDGIEMNNELYSNDLVSKHQPFNTTPWNYHGTETFYDTTINDVVDWVLVEFRDSESADLANLSTRISRQAALLMKDGSITDKDGLSNLRFYNSFADSLFAVIYHRNHLPVISSKPLKSEISTLTYDFSLSSEQVYGGSLGYVELSSGDWGMASGNAIPDYIIDEFDITETWMIQAGLQGYLEGDLNLDMEINNKDKNDFWRKNIDMESQVPQ